MWKGCPNSKGYGRFGLNGKVYKAHRISYLIHYGKLSQEMDVLHRCDVRRCVNPEHLFEGTVQDNAADRSYKGRTAKLMYEDNPNHKLTVKAVKSIRQQCKDGRESQKVLARYYGVSEATISYVVNEGRWKGLLSDD